MKNLILLLGFLIVSNNHITSSPISASVSIGIFGDKYQGDIKLTKVQEDILLNSSGNQSVKTGWTWEGFRWHKNSNGLVIVPYTINNDQEFAEREIEIVEKELTIIEHATCIRFVKRKDEEDYVEIINGNGCWSWLGRIGGRQELSLDRNGCLQQGITIHEFIHALGYDHMHNHFYRDDYVKIHWENIAPENYANFDRVDPQWFDNFGTPYDLMSVMHYPRWAFSFNGEDAIEPFDSNYIDKIGSPYLSTDDALRLNRMYNCY
ncbi:High choriolytic enzyme 1 [Pseudolycoriella hygida]|uniref:Metalloendopeptidase n=1 Tax=Pseudolycoriella hygida TaxID=35572 RepID=A0A9Q0MPS3_9DIPT|nr:High choriolytic enzyme 1 [Pseudolycoriella hygida]